MLGVAGGAARRSSAANAPSDLGVRDGKLKRPSTTPNSVSSQAGAVAGEHPQADLHRIAPLPLAGDGPATMTQLAALIASMHGARVVEREARLPVRLQFTTRLMKFVDDAEFWFDPAAGEVQVRSASRLGRKDFGVNRARIEAIRPALAAG